MERAVVSGWATAVLTAVLAIITGYYAWEARASRRIAREQLDSLVRPIITASLVLRHNHMIYLRVANDGNSPALDLRLALDQETPAVSDLSALGQLPLFREGSACVPPGAQYFFVLGGAPLVLGDNTDFPLAFGVTASYKWRARAVSEHLVIDVGSYKGSQAAPRTEAEAIEYLTDELKKSLGART